MVLVIARKSYSTLQKALVVGNPSLEKIQSQNPTLKTIKIRLKLVRWWQKCNFQTYSCILDFKWPTFCEKMTPFIAA